MRFYFTALSRNTKTGPMPVVTASKDSCPPTCTLLGKGCYAEQGKLGLFWAKMSRGEMPTLTFDELLTHIRALPRKQIWRYGQAGDLPDDPNQIRELTNANRGRPAIIYTHKRDFPTYRAALEKGLVVNLSANSMEEADALVTTGLPVVTVLPSEYRREEGESLRDYRDRLGGSLTLSTPEGNKIAICPEAYTDTNCLLCQACSKVRPGGTIIGFPAHGARKRTVDKNIALVGVPTRWVRHQDEKPNQPPKSTSFSYSLISLNSSRSKCSPSSQQKTTSTSAIQ